VQFDILTETTHILLIDDASKFAMKSNPTTKERLSKTVFSIET